MKKKKNVLVIIGDPGSVENTKIRNVLNKASDKVSNTCFRFVYLEDVTTNTVEGRYGYEDRMNRVVGDSTIIIADLSDGFLTKSKNVEALKYMKSKEGIIFAVSLHMGSQETDSNIEYLKDQMLKDFGNVSVMPYTGTSTFLDHFELLFKEERKQLQPLY
jgi:hypothetical protein